MKQLMYAFILTWMSAPAWAQAPATNCASIDPPRDQQHPAHNRQLLIPSHGVGLNALLFAASGAGSHPTVILAHGLPGNERNLDLAQAIRRCGWNALTFTYRGAWGSPGDFSIANAMDDARAALDFARSPEGTRLGIDPRLIVLAGHSMGGATAAFAAASDRQPNGLILLDAWNIAHDARTPKSELVAGFDDFGNSLHGATPESVAAEVVARGSEWDLVAIASRLAAIPVLTIAAKDGNAVDDRLTVAALRGAGNARVAAIEMDTDHSFNDHRIALAQAVASWLQTLAR